MNRARRAVIAISSHVVRGAIGNRSAVFALETFGFPVWSVPTVVLPWHPGHGRGTRIEPAIGEFSALLDDLAGSRWTGETCAILTGYMASAQQAVAVARFVERMREKHPGLVYLCDPVIGDFGGLYVAQETAAAIRDALLPLAAIATPNRHELGWLAGGAPVGTADAAISAARALPPPEVLVTSAPAFLRGNIANLLVRPDAAMIAEHRQVDGPPNGSGDLVSAVFLARLLEGAAPAEALSATTAAIHEIVSRAAARGSDELMPQTDRDSLLRPALQVTVRNLAQAAGARG